MRSAVLLASVVVGLALLSSACGGPSTASSSPSPTTAGPSPAASPSPRVATQVITIAVATNPRLGQILVDGSGETVYMLTADVAGTSTCYNQDSYFGGCDHNWPPVLTTGAPHAGRGAHASLLGTTARTDGALQVTYAHQPLYYFRLDNKPGDAGGQGIDAFGGLWWVVSPSGAADKKGGA